MRRVLPLPFLLLFAGCSDHHVPRDGYMVVSYAATRLGLTPGDTLREVWLDTVSRPLRAALRELVIDSAPVRGCEWVFLRDTLVFFYQPLVCGRQPHSDEWLMGSRDALLRADGRLLDSVQAGWAVGTLCPGDRAADGEPYYGDYWRLDGCRRRVFDTPDSLLTPGIPTSLGVILPNAVQRGLLDQCSRETPRRADFEWMPSTEVISLLEDSLPGWLNKNADSLPAPLSKYRRQYGGFGVGVDSLVYVNLGLPWDAADTDRHLRSPQIVCDGGKGYFGVVYNPRTRQFSQLAFNGTA